MAYTPVAHYLLNVLSHERNRMTNDQLQAKSEVDGYESCAAEAFLAHFQPYIDVRDKTILDIGCGAGNLAITLAKRGAHHVVGVDIDEERVIAARNKAVAEGVASCCTFLHVDFVNDYVTDRPFDVAFSQSAFEHILAPLDCLRKINACLAPGGVLGTLFGPLWLSPYGAHMWGFTSVPWVHLLFPESVVLRVRQEKYRPDEQVDRYENIRGHLNRITLRKFKQCAAQANFEPVTFVLNPAQTKGRYKWINQVINTVGPLQEFGAHQLLAVLRKQA